MPSRPHGARFPLVFPAVTCAMLLALAAAPRARADDPPKVQPSPALKQAITARKAYVSSKTLERLPTASSGLRHSATPTDWTAVPAPARKANPPVAPGPAAPASSVQRPPGVEYATITHRSISDVVIHRPDCEADAYLKDRLMLSDGITTASAEGTPEGRFIQAAVDEDDEYNWGPNYTRHFYNPVTNRGLDDGFPAAWSNSMEWACDGHDQDWKVAREAFYQAVTQSSKANRATQMSRAFKALGHVCHLVEDLAQPQHTRNDAHGNPLEYQYEDYCGTHYNTAGAVAALGSPAPPVFTATSSPFPRIPPEFAAFWDTGQYTGQAGFAGFGATPGLAEFSNAYFITDDTMFGATSTALLPRSGGAPPLQVTMRTSSDNSSTDAVHRFPFPDLRHTDLADWFPASTTKTSIQREGDALSGAVRYVSYTLGGVTIPNLFLINNSSFPFYYDHEIGFDDVTYQSAAQILIPKANAYATGITNLFFRGKIGLDDPTTTWDPGTQMNQLAIHNEGQDAFGAGTWSLYYDDVNGNRTPVPGFDASDYTGSLGEGGSFTAKFPEMLCDGDHEFTIVFRGKIGNEVDAVAARTFYTADELWVGIYDVPSGDPLCYEVADYLYAIFHRPTPPGYDIVGWIEFQNASDLFPVSGQCDGSSLQFGFNPQCGWFLSGTINGAALADGQTCCWYCPLNPPPTGPFFCGSVFDMQREQ